MHIYWWRKLGSVECDLCLQLMCCSHLFLIIHWCVSSNFDAWNRSLQGVGYHLYICFVHPRHAHACVSEQVLSIKSNLIYPKKARSLLTYVVSSAPKATLERTDPRSCFTIPGPPCCHKLKKYIFGYLIQERCATCIILFLAFSTCWSDFTCNSACTFRDWLKK